MTKENIVLAALRLFMTRGYKSVSLINVANEIGITKGGIYHYFSSKDELLQVSLHFLLDRYEAKYNGILSDSCTMREVLHSLMVERVVESFSKDLLQVEGECTLDYAHFAIEVMRKFPAIQERIEQSYLTIGQALAKRIQKAKEAGELQASLDSDDLAVAIMSMVNGQNSLGRSFHSAAARQRMAAVVWSMISA